MTETWFLYQDMHSGGGRKLSNEAVIIRADSEDEADRVFKERTGRTPDNVTCECCGPDFYCSAYDSLEDAMAARFDKEESAMVLNDD